MNPPTDGDRRTIAEMQSSGTSSELSGAAATGNLRCAASQYFCVENEMAGSCSRRATWSLDGMDIPTQSAAEEQVMI